MKWLVIVNTGLVICVCVLATTLWVQSETITTLISSQRALVQDFAALSSTDASLQRKQNDVEKRLKKLEKQTDLIAAATRMGWANAYRFMKEVGIE